MTFGQWFSANLCFIFFRTFFVSVEQQRWSAKFLLFLHLLIMTAQAEDELQRHKPGIWKNTLGNKTVKKA